MNDLLEYYLYEPCRILFLELQVRHSDKTLQNERERKRIILESIAHDEALLDRLQDELMQLRMRRAGI